MGGKAQVDQPVYAKSGRQGRLVGKPRLALGRRESAVAHTQTLRVEADAEAQMPCLQVGIRTVEQLVVKLLCIAAQGSQQDNQYGGTASDHALLTHGYSGLLS